MNRGFEHTYGDFEVRFFCWWPGWFYLHLGERVSIVLSQAGAPHWFGMGKRPTLKAIRLFLSDIMEALDAAAKAGMQSIRGGRDGLVETDSVHRQVHNFGEIELDRLCLSDVSQ